MKRSFTILSLGLLTASSLCAQTVTPHERTIPAPFTGHMAPSANLAPLARTKVFMQTWYHGANFIDGAPVFTRLGFRLDSASNAPAIQHKFEVVLSNTTTTFSTLSTTFTQNLSNPVTFFAMKTVNIPAATPNNDPNKAHIWIPADRPFVYQGPHVIVQFDVQTATTAGSNAGFNVDAYTMSSTPLHYQQGVGCSSASLQASSTTSSWNLTLSGAPASSSAVFLIGFSKYRFAKSIPLPLPLDGLGMTGCTLDVDPLLVFPVPTTSSGSASVQIPISLAQDDAIFPYAQCIVPDTSKPAGLSTTNVTTSLLQTTGISTYVYNWTTFTPTAQYGPYTTNRGAALLFR